MGPGHLTRRVATWRLRGAAIAVLAVLASVCAGGQVTLAGGTGGGLALHRVWRVKLSDGPHGEVALGSPTPATLAGGAAVVFGDRAGRVYALELASGGAVREWPKDLGVPVTSTPSVLRLPGTTYDTVIVGTGDAAEPCAGGYEWLLPSGADDLVRGPNPATDRACAADGVFAGIAVGTLGRVTAAVAGTLGQETYAMDATTRAVLPGFPWFQADSNFATPAIADVDGNGENQIVEGGAQTAGLAYRKRYTQGGHIRVLSATGKLECEDTTDESVNSSPAVGRFLAHGAVGIVAGTGPTFPTASQHDDVIAVDADCHEVWARKLAGTTGYESPALADVLGNGQLQVLVTTRSGGVDALDGATGAVLWHTQLAHDVYGSPVTADLGTGQQDVVVATIDGFDVLTGAHGHVIDATVMRTTAFQNAPLVTKDANGSIGVTVVGYQRDDSVAAHFEIVRSDAADVDAPGAWPEFHHDPQLTGDADATVVASSRSSASKIAGTTVVAGATRRGIRRSRP